MSLYFLNKARLIGYRRYLPLISMIVLFGFLASVAAPLVASLLLTKGAKGSIRDRGGEVYLAAAESAIIYDASLSLTQILAKLESGKEKKRLLILSDLSERIVEQRRILAELESEAKKKRILELIGDNNLLLMLNTRFYNQLKFFNKWLTPPSNDESDTKSFENFALDDKMALNVILEAPNTIDLTQTAKVEVSIDWNFPDEHPIPKTLPVIDVNMESPDFKISSGKLEGQNLPISNFGKKRQAWVWLISPEKTGDRKISLSFRSDNNQPVPILRGNETKEYEVLIPITVLTELGLSSTQNAWVKAIGAILGIIGTVAGYSFWKRRTQKKNKLENILDDEEISNDYEETWQDKLQDKCPLLNGGEQQSLLDAEIILRALAKYLKEQEAKFLSEDKDKARNIEGVRNK